MNLPPFLQGVIKHIIPAVASTNAVIAAACALEVVKVATACADALKNYIYFEVVSGRRVGVMTRVTS